MHGSSVVLQTRFKSVVFPALARPITRMRKWVYIFRASKESLKSKILMSWRQGALPFQLSDADDVDVAIINCSFGLARLTTYSAPLTEARAAVLDPPVFKTFPSH